MIIVAGSLIVKDNKILMVQEAKKECYGQWNFPAGHVDEKELITDAAIRETFEETGCKIKLTGVLPISTIVLANGQTVVTIKFSADIIDENIKVDKTEQLDVQWIELDKVKSMTKEELRGFDTALNDIRIVTDKSADSMDRFAEKANEAAKNLGASTLEYTNASLIYYQQGLSDAETQARAETTIKAANVTGQTGQEVSEQLTAVWNGYKVTAEETELYIDKLAAVADSSASNMS